MKRIIAILLMITAAAAVHAQETVLPKFDLCITSSIGIGGSINVAGIRSYSIHHEQQAYEVSSPYIDDTGYHKEGDIIRRDAYTEKITTIPAGLTFMASFKFNRIFFGAEYCPPFNGHTYAVAKLGWNYIHNKDNVKGHYNMSTYLMVGEGETYSGLLGVGTSGEIARHLSLNGSILLGEGINGRPISITLSIGITVDLHFLAF